MRAQLSEEEKEAIVAADNLLDELFGACEEGDCAKIKSWVEQGGDVNTVRAQWCNSQMPKTSGFIPACCRFEAMKFIDGQATRSKTTV